MVFTFNMTAEKEKSAGCTGCFKFHIVWIKERHDGYQKKRNVPGRN